MIKAEHLRLNIDSKLVTPNAENFQPSIWPPNKDFPVVLDQHGAVVSRYGEPIWELWPWAKTPTPVNFGDGPQRQRGPRVTKANADILRQIAAWWLWGPRAVREPGTLLWRVSTIRPLFVLCSREGIVATDLHKFPAVADKLSVVMNSSHAASVLTLLHRLYEERTEIGLLLLDADALRRFESRMPDHKRQQTPYIPPRIWKYQVNRLREVLTDFYDNRDKIDSCYRFCLDAYARNFGSLAAACGSRGQRKSARSPFTCRPDRTGAVTGAMYHGAFSITADRFGISWLLKKWVLADGESIDGPGRGIRTLTSLLTLVGYAGFAYLLNFSLMRAIEAWNLRADCLEVEIDDFIGKVSLLRGVTTKTVEDSDARWITSSSTTLAVAAMSAVSNLRMISAKANPKVPTDADHLANPFLTSRPYEPWSNTSNADHPLSIRPNYPSYSTVISSFPRLFDVETLRVTEDDLRVMKLVSPNVDIYVGDVWPFAWHQLRRTGAVNMQASGFVSDASVQYQLKHATRAMTLYYGQGRSRLKLNSEAASEYIRTMYEVLSIEIASLFSDRFLSPYGNEHKDRILKLVNAKDDKKLAAAARAGQVSYRRTLFGGCTTRGSCSFGGIDNVIRCGGGEDREPCGDGWYDREREWRIRCLGEEIAARLRESPVGSPESNSLLAQKAAVDNVLRVFDRG